MVDLVITMWFKNILITGVWNTNWFDIWLIMFIFYEQINHSNMNSDMGKKLWDRIIELKQADLSRHWKALGVNMRIEKFTLRTTQVTEMDLGDTTRSRQEERHYASLAALCWEGNIVETSLNYDTWDHVVTTLGGEEMENQVKPNMESAKVLLRSACSRNRWTHMRSRGWKSWWRVRVRGMEEKW